MADLELAIRIAADVKAAQRSLGAVERDLKDLGKPIKDGTKPLQRGLRTTGKLAKSIKKSLFSLKGALAGIGVGASVTAIAKLSDRYKSLESGIKLVTDSQDDLNTVMEATFKVAQETRSSWESTSTLYARVARNSEELGLSQQQLLDITKLTNQSLIIGGASASESAAGVIQLSQALASGVLRGDEFKSVAENMPRLAQAIADGLNISIGKLREYANAGKLSADVVTKAMLTQTQTINKEFGSVNRTVSSALQQMRNQVLKSFGDVDTSGLTDGIDLLTETLTSPATIAAFKTFASAIVDSIGTITKVITKTVAAARGLGEKIAELTGGRIDIPIEMQGVDDVTENIARVRKDLKKLTREGSFDESISRFFNSKKIKELNKELETLQQRALAVLPGRTIDKPTVETDKEPPVLLPEGDSGGRSSGQSEADKTAENIERIIQKLSEEKEQFGLTAEAIEIYRLKKLGASDVQLQQAQQLQAGIEALRAEAEAQEAAKESAESLAEQKQENLQADAELLTSMAAEIQLMQMTDEQRQLSIALRSLSVDATEQQREAVEALIETMQKVGKQQESFQKMEQQVAGLARGTAHIIEDALVEPWNASLKDMLRSFSEMITRMIARTLALIAVQKLLNAVGGAIGGTTGGALASVASSLFHTGGIAGVTQTARRNVDPAVFIGARRYHDGGVAGLKSDEVPTILRRNEEVLTENNPRHISNQSGGESQQNGVRILNMVDPAIARDYLESSEGESVILNVIQRNAGAVKEVFV